MPLDNVALQTGPVIPAVFPLRLAGDEDPLVAAQWGWFPALSVVGATGIFMVAIADTLARGGVSGAELLFWTGLLVLFVPIAARLLSATPATVSYTHLTLPTKRIV